MPTINFYNYYHNGDLFCSKSYIRQIIKDLPNFNFKYFHRNNPKTISDLVEYGGQPYQDNKSRFLYDTDSMSINTWIGIHIKGNFISYPPEPYFWNEGINYVALHNIWRYNFEKINSHFNVNLKISDKIEDYISTIDYTKFDMTSVDQFLKSRPNRKRIVFSNGVPMSGQSFAYNMQQIILNLAEKYDQYDFYCTDRITSNLPNIFFTSDITRQTSDLNEISWLSRSCDIIVGKNSGPFIYCLERDNFMNPNKTFISFNNSKIDSLDWGIDIGSRYICHTGGDIQEIYNLLDDEIGKL